MTMDDFRRQIETVASGTVAKSAMAILTGAIIAAGTYWTTSLKQHGEELARVEQQLVDLSGVVQELAVNQRESNKTMNSAVVSITKSLAAQHSDLVAIRQSLLDKRGPPIPFEGEPNETESQRP